MSARQLLDTISEYISMKDNAEMHPGLISREQAEDQLNEIAARFEAALKDR